MGFGKAPGTNQSPSLLCRQVDRIPPFSICCSCNKPKTSFAMRLCGTECQQQQRSPPCSYQLHVNHHSLCCRSFSKPMQYAGNNITHDMIAFSRSCSGQPASGRFRSYPLSDPTICKVSKSMVVDSIQTEHYLHSRYLGRDQQPAHKRPVSSHACKTNLININTPVP
jgi:hypothetical protein